MPIDYAAAPSLVGFIGDESTAGVLATVNEDEQHAAR